jgi:hypothetical protein
LMPGAARLLHQVPRSTARLTDLQRWAGRSQTLEEYLLQCNPGTKLRLVSTTDLAKLLCSSVAHGLQLLVAACNTVPGAAAGAAASQPRDADIRVLWRLLS